jgi:hypothetical protein
LIVLSVSNAKRQIGLAPPRPLLGRGAARSIFIAQHHSDLLIGTVRSDRIMRNER